MDLSIIISILFFVFNIMIVLILRSIDKNKSNAVAVRKMVEDLKNDVDKKIDSFKAEVSDIQTKLEEKNESVRELMQTVTNQIAQLNSYSDDFSKLNVAITGYQNALTALAKLTRSADEKMNKVEADVDRLEEVKFQIEGFRKEIQETEEEFRQEEIGVIQHVRETANRFREDSDAYIKDAIQKLNDASNDVEADMQSTIVHVNEKTKAAEYASSEMKDKCVEAINSMCDKTIDEIESRRLIDNLKRKKEQLLQELDNIDQNKKERTFISNDNSGFSIKMQDNVGNISLQDAEKEESPIDAQFEIGDMTFDITEDKAPGLDG